MTNTVAYKYTEGRNWFDDSELKKLGQQFISGLHTNHILEIGCFEGLSSVWIADNLLQHPLSSLVCVDPFTSIEDNDHGGLLDGGQGLISQQESHFLFNISNCTFPAKVRFCRTTSDQFLAQNTQSYNFIYLDGNHTIQQIPKDIDGCFHCLAKGGVLWMDDYKGGEEGRLQQVFDDSLSRLSDRFTVIHSGYQIAIRKKA